MGHSDILLKLRAAAGDSGELSYNTFTQIALYDADDGYYAKAMPRVGKHADTDFYTATSLGPFLGQLVAAAAQNLLGGASLEAYALVEIGVEPSGSVFQGLLTEFGEVRALGLKDALELPERAVVFANELFDAQSFYRLIFAEGAWRECGVRFEGEHLSEFWLPEISEELATRLLSKLPAKMPELWRLDISLAAEDLLASLLEQNWSGLFITADYGYSLSELLSLCPQGTARAYHRHRASKDLLALPGQQDLSCHVCWDNLEGVLMNHGFEAVRLQRQEAFFVETAGSLLEQLLSEEASLSTRGALQALMHPSHMGGCFQVLSARRF